MIVFMKYILIILLLTSCTPEIRKEISEGFNDAADDFEYSLGKTPRSKRKEKYGPVCESIGYIPNTEKYADCLLKLYSEDIKRNQ